MWYWLDFGRWFYFFILFKVVIGGVVLLILFFIMNVGGGLVDVGIVNVVGSIFLMFGGFFWGKFSDRFNRRKVFLFFGFFGIVIMIMSFVFVCIVY